MCRDSVGLKKTVHNPGIVKQNTHFEIRLRFFIHTPSADTSRVVMKKSDGYYLHTWHHSNQYQRQTCTLFIPTQLLLASVGCTQVREWELMAAGCMYVVDDDMHYMQSISVYCGT